MLTMYYKCKIQFNHIKHYLIWYFENEKYTTLSCTIYNDIVKL